MRKAHYLTATDSNTSPSEAIWFDTETRQVPVDDDTVEHHLMFGWACYRRKIPSGEWCAPKWFRFETVAEFWDWVVSLHRPKTKLYMFCHNTNFDLPVMDTFVELPQRGYSLRTAVIDAPPTILKWGQSGRTIQILDTLNIWRMPLARLGSSLGLDKLSFPSDDDPPEVWNTYAQRDVEIIMLACIRWWQFLVDNDMGGFANTLAAQSLLTFRHKHLTADIYIDDNAKALSLSRSAYMGARTECFRIGPIDEQLYLVDINSQYPFVMKNNVYPVMLRGYTKRATVKDLEDWLIDASICADVEVTTDEPVYPFKKDGKLCFPVGRFRSSLCSGEIQHAIRRNHISKVYQASVYNHDDIFSRFVDDIYRRRLQAMAGGDAVNATFYKILLNSLYGKFGQNGLIYEECDNINDLTAAVWHELDADTGQIVRFRQFGGIVQRQSRSEESRHSHPAIAAHVTSYGRMYLWKLMQMAGAGNYYYCDTDSLLVNEAGFNNLKGMLDKTRLGYLKLEYECEHAVIHGPKDYTFGDHTKTKGVKRNAVWTGPSEITQQKWSSLRGLLASGHITNPTTKTITKRLRRVYDKGVVLDDGWVRPLYLGAELPPGGDR